MAGVKRKIFTDSDNCALYMELDEVVCPICLDHPHNAVLLMCSSHEKGCRAYICDTSYRHSNCLDRFKKLAASSTSVPMSPVSAWNSSVNSDRDLALQVDLIEGEQGAGMNEISSRASVPFQERPEGGIRGLHRHLGPHGEGFLEIGDPIFIQERIEVEELDEGNSSEAKSKLKCPLCRGDVLSWVVVEEARKYLNLKKRGCSRESCSFVGNYRELRQHARMVHPTIRPSDVDPSREQAWRHLERQREHGDIVSAIQSAMPGAVVVGDYAIENVDSLSAERENDASEDNVPWLTTFFLFRMLGSMDRISEQRVRSRAWSRQRRPLGSVPERRFLWGENLLGLQDDSDDEDDLRIFTDVDEDATLSPRRHRRRYVQSRSDEEQP